MYLFQSHYEIREDLRPKMVNLMTVFLLTVIFAFVVEDSVVICAGSIDESLSKACDISTNGPVAAHFPITYISHQDGKDYTMDLCIYYIELLSWKETVNTFAKKLHAQMNPNIAFVSPVEQITAHVEVHLNKLGYAREMVNGNDNSRLPQEFITHKPISSSTAVLSMMDCSYFSTPTENEYGDEYGDDYSGIIDMKILKHTLASESEGEGEGVSEIEPHKTGIQKHNADVLSFFPAASPRRHEPLLFLSNQRIALLYRLRENPLDVTRSFLAKHEQTLRVDTICENTATECIPDARTYLDNQNHNHANNIAAIKNYARPRPLFIVYQTRGVNTGGTVALNSLYRNLHGRAGIDTILCDEKNHLTTPCKSPPVHAVVITGEWCHEVLNDHGIDYHHGRGIQYHLGFHHSKDVCAGHIAIGVSQYTSTTLHNRILSAYYLGAPMSRNILNEFHRILTADNQLYDKHGHHKSFGIAKENILVIDPDLEKDYTPEMPLIYNLSSGIRPVIAAGIPHRDIPLLLHRAKVVLDLAMPGAERLVGEGALLGAVPIISSRWNGASEVDFPGVISVDAQNATAVTEAIAYAFTNYEDLIKNSAKHSQFMQYMMSMEERMTNTVDILVASSTIKFVMKTNTLEEEVTACLMATIVHYLFPLAAIDIYVADVAWFARHHYPFMNVMNNVGATRTNAFAPNAPPSQRSKYEDEESGINNSSGEKVEKDNISLLRILSHSAFRKASHPTPTPTSTPADNGNQGDHVYEHEYEQEKPSGSRIFTSTTWATTVVLLSVNGNGHGHNSKSASASASAVTVFANAHALLSVAEEQLVVPLTTATTTRTNHAKTRTTSTSTGSSSSSESHVPILALYSKGKGRSSSGYTNVNPSLFALVFPPLRSADENEDDRVLAFYCEMALQFFEHTDTNTGSATVVKVRHVAIADSSLRLISDLPLCPGKRISKNPDMNLQADARTEILDGIVESSVWLTLSAYYCNIRK